MSAVFQLRLCSILRKYGQDVPTVIDFELLDRPEEQRVVELLADFPQVVIDASEHYEPYFIASYLLKLAAAFNRVYQRKDADNRIDKIVSELELEQGEPEFGTEYLTQHVPWWDDEAVDNLTPYWKTNQDEPYYWLLWYNPTSQRVYYLEFGL